MGTRSKSFSHSIFTKIVVFMIVILCLIGVIKQIVEIEAVNNSNLGIVFEEDYFRSESYMLESERVIGGLTRLIGEFKNEEHILSGGTINEDQLRSEEAELYDDYQFNSRSYNPQLSEGENYEKFKQEYADKIVLARDRLIKADLREYHSILEALKEYKNPLYYANDGVNVYTNTKSIEKGQFKSNPSYMLFEEYNSEFYPEEISGNENLHWITEGLDDLATENSVVYIAFTDDFLDKKINEWQENKVTITKSLYILGGFLAGLILSLLYLVIVLGRKSFNDELLHLNVIDKLYNDINIVLCTVVISLWFILMDELFEVIEKVLVPFTIPFAAVGLVLVLSLIKHIKNKTFFKHTLIYSIFYKLFDFVREVYDNGSIAVKTVLIVIGYPIVVAVTFFIFPITLGFAAWLALKRIKSFNTIQAGVKRIKDGDIYHRIDVAGKGELAELSANINSITDGLKTAVDSELKSERLKTELITNVSHDIRTPLTSIITYVDLLKKETDPAKIKEYVEVLDQKSKRLKVLTDDLFEAAKASSGNIPVNFERIDVISLITQGLGEVNEKIEAYHLDFKVNLPKEKLFVKADGKLLWRSIENLLSNIFKYTLRGSRVYIDIEDLGYEVLLTFKNISAYELNISADELMERFKRGDESRLSQGSGLGLSIAKSLIEAQNGKFVVQVDGDLFKAMIYMPKQKIN